MKVFFFRIKKERRKEVRAQIIEFSLVLIFMITFHRVTLEADVRECR
jgi:hypothetical protein